MMSSNNIVDKKYIKLAYKSWAFIGVTVSVVIILALLIALSSLVVPLIIALVIGILFAPLVDIFSKHMPRKLASSLVLIGLLLIIAGSIWLVFNGIADQADEIKQQLSAGFDKIGSWLEGRGLNIGSGSDNAQDSGSFFGNASTGLAGYLAGAFTSVGTFLAGSFVGVFLLYYILDDWKSLNNWISSHLKVPRKLAQGIIKDAVWSIRQYFYSLTTTSLVAAIVIGVVAAMLGVPLAFTIALITFLTSYIPYIGAFLSGAFAVLIALGSGGLDTALVLLGTILLSQMIIQPLLENKISASKLELNPAVNFAATVVGTSVAGILGATLASPFLAAFMKINKRVKEYDK